MGGREFGASAEYARPSAGIGSPSIDPHQAHRDCDVRAADDCPRDLSELACIDRLSIRQVLGSPAP
jgi:hypothetical protein